MTLVSTKNNMKLYLFIISTILLLFASCSNNAKSDIPSYGSFVEKEGIQFDGKVYIACYPRILGYVFNPISVYFYFNNTNCLEVIVYEVKNTFGDQHSYLIKTKTNSSVLTHSCKKKMIVSPFNSLDHTYEFKTIVPDNKFYLSIDELENKEKILSAYLE